MQYVILKSTAGLVLMPSKVDPKVRRWQLPGGEYMKKKDIPTPEGTWKEDDPKAKAEWEEYFKQEHDWEKEVSTAVAEGRLDPDDARRLGLYLNTSADNIEPLPKVVYHVTTAKSRVMEEGLKTRDQLRQKSGAGLGGGTSNTISFTEDQSIAVAIYKGIMEGRRVAKGEFTIEQMIKDAKEGKGAKMTFWKMILDYYYPRGVAKDETDPPAGIVDMIKGIERAHRGTIGTPKTLEEWQREDNIYAHGKKNWKGVPDKNLPEGKFLEFEREMTPEERREQAMEFYKLFSAFRESAGGPLDPLFFSNDVEALANMKPEDIAIMKFEGKGEHWMTGRKGYKVSSLGEWRAFSGVPFGKGEDVTKEFVKSDKRNKVAIMSLMWATLRGIPRVKEPVEKSLFVILEKAGMPGMRIGHAGLVAKKVQVKKMGKPYQAIRWMKPGEEPPKQEQPKQEEEKQPKQKKQGKSIKVYHQSDTGELHSGEDVYGLGEGFFVSKKKLPEGFYGEKTSTFYLKPDTKLFDFQNWAKENNKNLMVTPERRATIIKEAKDKAVTEGYDGIEILPDDIWVFNKDKITEEKESKTEIPMPKGEPPDWVKETPEYKAIIEEEKKVQGQEEKIRAYHGTIDDFVLSEIHAGLDENAPIDRLIGPHFAQDPEISNKFAAGLYRERTMQMRQVSAGVSPASVLGWGVSEAREMLPVGGKVFPVALEIKKPREVPQPRYTGKGESGALMSDQVAIACDIARVVFPQRKDLWMTWATKTGALSRENAEKVYDGLKAGKEITAEEAGAGREAPRKWAEEHGMPYDFGFYTYEYGALFFDDKQELTKEYKRILGEQGYDGLKYQNTSPMETEGVKNINTYVPFSINQVKSIFEKSWDIVDDLLKAFEARHRTDEEMTDELKRIRYYWKEAKKQRRKESRGGISFQHYEEVRSDT